MIPYVEKLIEETNGLVKQHECYRDDLQIAINIHEIMMLIGNSDEEDAAIERIGLTKNVYKNIGKAGVEIINALLSVYMNLTYDGF